MKIFQEKKPFHFKYKLFYQTKINLWDKNQQKLVLKLKKKKWNFIRFIDRRDRLIPNFKFNIFSRNFSKRYNRFNFKNNLYFRKLLRFKYSRLKNKELYKLFKSSNNYKEFIGLLGSRLDIFLYRILKKNKSVFNLRQLLLHKNVLLNGRKIKSPNYKLKKFDIISLKLSDFSSHYFSYQNPYEMGYYFCFMAFYLSKHVTLELLNKESRNLFIKDVCNILCPQFFDAAFILVEHESNEYLFEQKEIINNRSSSFSKYVTLKEFIALLKLKFLEKEILTELKILESLLLFEELSFSFNYNSLGFFDSSLIGIKNFEFKFYKGYLDIIFLGVSDHDKFINTNDKYLLHYLYF